MDAEKTVGKPEPVTTLAREPITHLDQYLAYYITQLEPGYAVLVTGGWGSGKTFQVRRVLPDDRAHYVSLFGLNSPAEIEAHIFTKMFPDKAKLKSIAEKFNAVSIGFPGVATIGTSGIGTALANTFIKSEVETSKPLILDDLERCSVDNKVIIGLINRYVEHHECRVIVIAHDDKIVEGFKEAKEKVFGQTILVEPNTDAAFDSFIKLFLNPSEISSLGGFVRESLTIFKESKASSLRVLRHVVEDVMRLMRELDSRHVANRAAMVELVRLFSALSIEVRANKLDRDGLTGRREKSYSYRFAAGRREGEKPKPPIVAAASNYVSVQLDSMILNDEVLAEMLIEGRFDRQKIRASLNASAYFIEKEVAPPWQVVSNFDSLDDADVQQGLDRMNDQLANQRVTESGEFLHIFSLQLMMASKGLYDRSVDDVVSDSKAYIDGLLRAKKLPPREAGSNWADSFIRSFGGYIYWETKEHQDKWQEVLSYLIEARTKALEATFPEKIADLLATLNNNGEAFFEKLCFTSKGTPEFDDIPILARIEPKAFVDAWLLSPKRGWYWIGNALKKRYETASVSPTMKPESAWLPQVAEKLAERADAEKGLAKLRIMRASELMGLPPRAAVEADPKPAPVAG